MSVQPYYQDDSVVLYHGDSREVLANVPADSLESCVTDPPYELGFMGRKWDSNGIAYDKSLWGEVFRVLKPGGHLLAFGGTRTWHRLAVAIEDAGFEVRDSIAWMYGSGFPKSLDVSKAIDKAAGAEREVVGTRLGAASVHSGPADSSGSHIWTGQLRSGEAITPAAQQCQGWGTALKPAHEPIVVARKPLIGTVAENVLAHGTGALNIDGCRIGYASDADKEKALAGDAFKRKDTSDKGWSRPWMEDAERVERMNREAKERAQGGRWPANVILDESQAEELDRQSGVTDSTGGRHSGSKGTRDEVGQFGYSRQEIVRPTDTGGASRFFYVAKASARERPRVDGVAHPTVKPLKLMRYLVRLVTPPGGTVLEPFAGSGTTAEAAIMEGFKCVAVEMTEDYLPLIVHRLSKAPVLPEVTP